MSDPVDANVIELGGEPRLLKIDFKAAKAISRGCGIGLLAVNQKLREYDFEILEIVLWAALLHKEPNLTVGLTRKRIESYQAEHTTVAPLFLACLKASEESGLYVIPDPSEHALGNATATEAGT